MFGSTRDQIAERIFLALIASDAGNDYEEEAFRRNDYPGYCANLANSAFQLADAFLHESKFPE